ncbi:hypothetical protein F5051DRAFT_433076 [Lentinula edodes]|nr:hypothetical protein F5051DRAFT_433076 [Lentinula edodes]
MIMEEVADDTRFDLGREAWETCPDEVIRRVVLVLYRPYGRPTGKEVKTNGRLHAQNWPKNQRSVMLMAEKLVEMIQTAGELELINWEGYFPEIFTSYNAKILLGKFRGPWGLLQNIESDAGIPEVNLTTPLLKEHGEYPLQLDEVQKLEVVVPGTRGSRQDTAVILGMIPKLQELTIIWLDSELLIQELLPVIVGIGFETLRIIERDSRLEEHDVLDLKQIIMHGFGHSTCWVNGELVYRGAPAKRNLGLNQFPDEVTLKITSYVLSATGEIAELDRGSVINLGLCNRHFHGIAQEIVHQMIRCHNSRELEKAMSSWEERGEEYSAMIHRRLHQIGIGSFHMPVCACNDCLAAKEDRWSLEFGNTFASLANHAYNLKIVSLDRLCLCQPFFEWGRSLSRPVELVLTRCTILECFSNMFEPCLKFSTLTWEVSPRELAAPSLWWSRQGLVSVQLAQCCGAYLKAASLTIDSSILDLKGIGWILLDLPHCLSLLKITCVEDAWPADMKRRMLMGEVVLDIIRSSGGLSDLTIEGYFPWSLLRYSLPGPLNRIRAPWNFVQNVDKNAGVIDLDMTGSRIISGFRDCFVMFPAVETLAFKVRGSRDTREDINSVLRMYPGVREVTIVWEDSTELVPGEGFNEDRDNGPSAYDDGNNKDEVVLMIAINVYDSNGELAKQRVEDILNFMMASKQFQRVGVEALHGLLDVRSADRLQCVMEGWRRNGEHYKMTVLSRVRHLSIGRAMGSDKLPDLPDLLVGLSDLVSNSSRLAQVSINGYKLDIEFYDWVRGLSRPMKLSVTQCLMREIVTSSQGGLKFSKLALQQNTISTVRNWGGIANVELASMCGDYLKGYFPSNRMDLTLSGPFDKVNGPLTFVRNIHPSSKVTQLDISSMEIGSNWRQLAVRFPELRHICVRTVGGYNAGEDITAVLEFYKVRDLTIIWESSQFLGISKVKGIDIKDWQLWLKRGGITTSIWLNGGLVWHTSEE